MTEIGNHNRGTEIIESLWGPQAAPSKTLQDMSELTNDYLFGVVWDREKLRLRDRCMITVATLAALGWERNLATHMRGALKGGVTRDEIIEMMIHVAHYAGWPAGMTGLRIADEIFSEADSAKQS